MNLRGKFQSPYSALLSTVFALPQQLPTDRIHAFYSENQPKTNRIAEVIYRAFIDALYRC